MKRLTEEMVIARTKTSDLSAIKRLNCWGSDLTDVSLLRRMSSVEVLSLSINKIGSLADFQECSALRELYIRQNNIRDLNEVCYLRDLQHLRSLWLGENPCAVRDGYRLSVIRALPHLQKLDDVEVTPEEVSDATRRGKPLVHPDDQDDSDQRWVNRPSPDRSPVGHHDYSPERRQPSYEQETEPEFYEREESPDKRIYNSPTGQKSPPRQYDPEPRRTYSPEPADPPGTVYYDDNRRNYEQEAMRQIRPYQYDRSPNGSNNTTTDEYGTTPESPKDLPHSGSSQSFKDYTNGDRYTATVPHQERDVRYRQTADAGSDGSNHSHSGYELLQPHTRSARDRSDRCERAACNVNHRPPFHRRPVTRNSNILSAVLCLVKELDYPSLEVVEMAVRCRMDELED